MASGYTPYVAFLGDVLRKAESIGKTRAKERSTVRAHEKGILQANLAAQQRQGQAQAKVQADLAARQRQHELSLADIAGRNAMTLQRERQAGEMAADVGKRRDVLLSNLLQFYTPESVAAALAPRGGEVAPQGGYQDVITRTQTPGGFAQFSARPGGPVDRPATGLSSPFNLAELVRLQPQDRPEFRGPKESGKEDLFVKLVGTLYRPTKDTLGREVYPPLADIIKQAQEVLNISGANEGNAPDKTKDPIGDFLAQFSR